MVKTCELPTESEPHSPGVVLAVWALLGVLAASTALVSAEPRVLVVMAALVGGLAWPGGFAWGRAGRLILRMKWFYLSLLVFYGLWPMEGGNLAAGLQEAGTRILALVLVLLLVVWLTERFSRPVLVRSLGLVLGGPWQVFGAWGERFARRLFLALIYFEGDRPAIKARRDALGGARKARLEAVREWLVQRLDQALSGEWGAEDGPAEHGHGPENRAVPWTPVIGLWAGVLAAWLTWWFF